MTVEKFVRAGAICGVVFGFLASTVDADAIAFVGFDFSLFEEECAGVAGTCVDDEGVVLL